MSENINRISANLSIRLYKGRHIKHKPDWHSSKTPADYTIWNILGGSIVLMINNKVHKLSKGDIVIFYPGNKYIAASEEGCEFLFIYFKIEAENGIDFLKEKNMPGIIPAKLYGEKCVEFSGNFMRLYTKAKDAPLRLYALFLNYFTDIADAMAKKGCIHFCEISKYKNVETETMLEYIENHLHEDLRAKTLAGIFNMSEKYFSRKFKAEVGYSPWYYVTLIRMRKAAELLSGTSMKIWEIAKITGYADQYSFSKSFKRIMGASPVEYRGK